MSIRSERELAGMRAAGRVVRRALDAMAAAARPGVSTSELDAICERVLADHAAEAAPRAVYGFPAAACISVNDEAIHGVPGDRVLAEGDLVKLDVTVSKDGYYADAAMTVRVGAVSETADRLARCAESAFARACKVARTGYRVYDIGRAVEKEVRSQGFRVMRNLCGHGIGRTIHEDPQIYNYFEPRARERLTEGLVITIEPIIAAGAGETRTGRDRWTVSTRDGSLAAHYEHTLVITRSAPILITAA
jgi:methionyl aminopeptidase